MAPTCDGSCFGREGEMCDAEHNPPTAPHDPAKRARALLDDLHPHALAELAREEPDWDDLCSCLGCALLFVAAPDLARDVLSLAADLAVAHARADAADARTSALTAAARDHMATQYRAADDGRDANRDALDALLAGAPSGVVSAAVVQAYRNALDAYDAAWALDSDAPERTTLDAARAALNAALATAGCS